MKRKNVLIRSAAATCAALLALALTGCLSNPIETLVNEATDEIFQGTAGELDEPGAADGINIEFQGIPDNFPKDVPLVSTNVVHSIEISGEEGQGVSLTVSDPRDPADVAQIVRDDFSQWEEAVWTDLGELVSGQFTTDGMFVIVGVMEDDEGSLVQYMVYRE